MADHSIGVGKGCMKVGLVGPRCFVLFWQYFPGKVLLRRRWVCFIRYAFEFLWSWMQPEGMEFVQRSLPRENSWSMQFVETKKVRSRSPRELKFVRCIFRLEDLTKSVKWEAMWCLVVFRHDCMASFFPKVKMSSSWNTSSVSKEEVVYVSLHYSDWITRSKYYGGNHKANELQLPCR